MKIFYGNSREFQKTEEGKNVIFYATAWDCILEADSGTHVFHVKSAGNDGYVASYMGTLDEIRENLTKLEKTETTWEDDDGFIHHLWKTEAEISCLKAICDYNKHDETKKGTPREFREDTNAKRVAAVKAAYINK